MPDRRITSKVPDGISGSLYWRCNAGDCVWANYGESCVVFHRPSGKTHVLNSASYRLLTDILQRPEDTVTIAAKLLDIAADEVPASKLEEVHSLLVRFEYLGFVDRSVASS